ncbi:GNAT family N-acetyltransferase [Flavobacterium sp. MDT1-60]|uniref:GNAT family N-acetyltransferase n=1 Tax=Flavobacterium sp. MDT1-60 TaxID=1979344 RepID=UPI001785F492|nr:GNAT family N-acetyltransferase [Flavobacterium sp. MDT1-60]QOG01136.1 GNAT family N-acetyltransferase [Flavobacterium sp. MDT1-60]
MRTTFFIKTFNELTNSELYQILQLRSEVFVVEQNCVFQDIDNKDQESYHHLYLVDGILAGYTRLLPAGLSYNEISIGRVVTAPAFRGIGLGKELMQKSIEACEKLFEETTIRIGAQRHLSKFYNSIGFVESGEPYDEDGILHIEMVR